MRYSLEYPLNEGDWIWWRPFAVYGVEQERHFAKILALYPMGPYEFHRQARIRIYISEKESRTVSVKLDSYRVEIIDDPEDIAMIALGVSNY
jgi:hypothetical protein